ncbi:MAG: GNAT family N-acetyltransferase [Alphaproteobacteria bacterium]|nr:GNAT family N-acetyltransferase [Alphaproteobacteria bacterium]
MPNISIRPARISDAKALNRYIREIYADAAFLITRPDEFHMSQWRQRYWIAKKLTTPFETCLVAVDGNEIIGMLDCWTDRRRRIRHSTCFAMSVKRSRRGQGVGKKLLLHFTKWVQKHDIIERIELHVHSDNAAAISLYKGVGFIEEGCRKGAVRYEDGRIVDDHIMALWP